MEQMSYVFVFTFTFSLSTQRESPLPVLVFIDSLVVFASQDAGGYATSRQNNLVLRLGCHTFYISMPVVRMDGRAVGRCTVTWLPNFLGWVVYHIFLPMVLRCVRFARESPAIIIRFRVTQRYY